MMNSFRESLLFVLVKTVSSVFMLLPMPVSLRIGRSMGWISFYFLPKKRRVVYANLKTVFALEKSPEEINRLARDVFANFIQSAVELMCLPKIKRLGLQKLVTVEGRENIERASSMGKGVIFLAVHSGSWELASIMGGVTKGPYHIVANDQSKLPQLDKILNEYRTIAGAHVILAGVATKEIIKAMQNNEIVSLVLDQGGKHGIVVPFLDKTASMSTGAMRLALKYGSAVCPVWIERRANGRHVLKVFPPMSLTVTDDLEKDIKVNAAQAARHFSVLLKGHPDEYMWFYKVFKYSNESRILILDDGRTGHLRQSQAVGRQLTQVLKNKGKICQENTVVIEWRGRWAFQLFSVYVFLAQYFGLLRGEGCLKYFLTGTSYTQLMKFKADYIVSCGSQTAGINFILSHAHMARSISVLTPGIVSQERFDLVVMPEHDKPHELKRARLIVPKVAPNLISPAYLKEQVLELTDHFSHLKGNVRTKFGVLIGGTANGVKYDEAHIHELIDQLKQAASHYNADILLTTSRRTPPEIDAMIVKELKNFDRCGLCIIANQRNVPEAVGGILGLSDLVIVSGESISMVSEALSSGKRTLVFSPNGHYTDKPRDKYEEFVLKLNDQGYLLATSVYNIKAKITQLLSYKITLKALDDPQIIRNGLENFI